MTTPDQTAGKWDPAGEPAIAWMIEVIEARFDPTYVGLFAEIPEDPRVSEISNRVIFAVPGGTFGDRYSPAVVDGVVFRLAKLRDPTAVRDDPPDDENGYEPQISISPPWFAAMMAAFHAAMAYLYPHLMTRHEAAILKHRWEAVVGPWTPPTTE